MNYNFTDRVRKVLAMAREEAIRLQHDYVGTEHILLGLIREGEGVAAAVLTNLSVDLDQIHERVEESVRKGKVFIDWSQNSHHKTTIAPYSMRARPRPTVSTPVSWAEVAAAADDGALSFETAEVLDRVDADGDLFAPVLELEQRLPEAR